MIADLHAHYAMHLVPDAGASPFELISTAQGRGRLRDRVRARLVGLAGRFANYRSFESGPRVTVPLMREGGVGVALSVLYSFFDELDLDQPYGASPEPGYIDGLLRQLDLVETDIADLHPGEATVVHKPAELDAALAGGRLALVHCVEGGFHLGATPRDVDGAVARLAGRGVAYITLPHLFWRGVATNAPALPFLPDRVYRLLFPQPAVGLSELGAAAVAACAREGMLVDLCHMSERALKDTFALLDEVDPGRDVAVIASHGAVRFGGQEYNLSPETIERIAGRNGLIGLIFAQHQLKDGLRGGAKSFDESFDVLASHLDRIAELTGSHRHSAIGSDLDGFIKPTLGGIESMADMSRLEPALQARYGAADAELIASGNAVRVLRESWRGG